MGKKKQTTPKPKQETLNQYDFSENWEEIQVNDWEWIMWSEKGEEVIGWIVGLREEEFSDKEGNLRPNLVCYMATPDEKYVRFIVPTDLRKKLEILNTKREKAHRNWDEILIKIVYTGKTTTSKGFQVKIFNVLAKKENMPEEIASNIPAVPNISDEHSASNDDNDDDDIFKVVEDF
jgi:hypothetical protein